MPALLIISSQLIHHLSLGGALMHYSSRIESNSTMSPCWPVFSAKYTGIHELSCTYFEITGLWPHAGILFLLCIPHAVWPGMWVLQRRKGELRMLVSLEGCERIPHNSTQPWCGWPSASCHGRQLRNVCYFLIGLAYSPISCSVVSPFGPVPQVLQFKACLHKYFFKIVDELSSSVIAVALKRLWEHVF